MSFTSKAPRNQVHAMVCCTCSEHLICSIRLFPWYKYSSHGKFQITNVMSLKAELGRVYHQYCTPVFSGSSTSLGVCCDIYFVECSHGIQIISKDVELWSLGKYL